MKKLIFLSCRLGIYSFTKNRKFTGVLKGFWLHPPLTRLQTAIFKLEVLLSIFCGTKITLIWTTPIPPPLLLPSPQFLDLHLLPLLCLTHPLILKCFLPVPPILQYFEDYIPPRCKWARVGGGADTENIIKMNIITTLRLCHQNNNMYNFDIKN